MTRRVVVDVSGVFALPCPACGHTRCGSDCVCDCQLVADVEELATDLHVRNVVSRALDQLAGASCRRRGGMPTPAPGCCVPCDARIQVARRGRPN